MAAPSRFNAARGSGAQGNGSPHRESANESIGHASAHRKRTRILAPILGPFAGTALSRSESLLWSSGFRRDRGAALKKERPHALREGPS